MVNSNDHIIKIFIKYSFKKLRLYKLIAPCKEKLAGRNCILLSTR
ncbi:hypothetical protein HMPREF0742_02028 [Rothia aeria F0184]|uniref:Uncharacterized protein n=1 Tax=Rothia aeria F0184 TaxID=888019 RepID=U7V1B1_9MICC|nr:hypothetical protein HMPREF0742_02028 [Rothia aeria F0184]